MPLAIIIVIGVMHTYMVTFKSTLWCRLEWLLIFPTRGNSSKNLGRGHHQLVST
jgi:hypothetical protein